MNAALDEVVASVWAKSEPQLGEVEEWLPLWQHLDDSANVAELLWDHWVAASIRNLVTTCLPSPIHARQLFVWLAGAHDLGKASPAFASRGRELTVEMRVQGLQIGPMVQPDAAKLRHEVASAAILDRWCDRWTALQPRRRQQVTCIVGGHHGTFPTASAVSGAPTDQAYLFGSGLWLSVQDHLADRAAERAGIDGNWLDWSTIRLTQPAQMVLSALVIVADWIASNTDLFPLLPVGRIPSIPALSTDMPSRARAGWERLALLPQWEPTTPPESPNQFFNDRFPGAGGQPRPIQQACVELTAEVTEPSLLIIEAPMGEGKTEAAMLAAETMAAKLGLNGCYWALPTQATSNAMFERMLTWLDHLPSPTGSQTVALVHGKASLNDSYAGIPFARGAPGVRPEEPDRKSSAAAHEWFRGRKRSGLSAFVTGTIDSILFAALISKHMMLRHLGLVSKVVVIDEIHAADVFMSEFLDTALHWLAAASVPVVLLSATLPPTRRTALYRAYESGRRAAREEQMPPSDEKAIEGALGHELGYPVLIATGADGPDVRVIPPSARQSTVTIKRIGDGIPDLTNMLATELAEGGCAVVIRNTVRRAQETAQALSERFGTDNVTLAHAQFLAVDRLANDAALLRRFGRPGEGVVRPTGPHVVVATQVVEQSLDVDFDLMVTDLAPIDLILQRIGRLHRHTRCDRPIANAVCYVAGAQWSDPIPQVNRASAGIYGAWPLYRAAAVLADRWDGPIAMPADIPTLVSRAYGHDDVPTGWEATLADAREKYTAAAARRQNTAQSFMLPKVQAAGRSLYGASRFSVGNVDESPSTQGYVRDGGESVEVVVVQRGSDGQDRVPSWIPDGGEELPLRHSPVPYPLAKQLARCTLRLPFSLSHEGIVDAVLDELEQNYFEGWAQSPFLSGQLALVLDDNASAMLAQHRLHYDAHRGLEVEAPHTTSDQAGQPELQAQGGGA